MATKNPRMDGMPRVRDMSLKSHPSGERVRLDAVVPDNGTSGPMSDSKAAQPGKNFADDRPCK